MTRSVHSSRPQDVTRSQLTVRVLGLTKLRCFSSTGSRPMSCAIFSRCSSSANRGWGVPWPRLGPQGGWLVKTRHASNRYAGMSEVTGWSAPMHVVHDLRRRPQSDVAIDVCRDRAVLLHRQVRVALEEENILANDFRTTESSIDVTELESHELVNVVRPAVVLDGLVIGLLERGIDRHHGLEDLVLDRDRVARGRRDLLFEGRDRRDGVADVAHFLVLEGALVL